MSFITPNNPASPNAIPQRSSSTGHSHGPHHQPSKSVLVPLPEDSWLASKMTAQPENPPAGESSNGTTSPPLAPIQTIPERRHFRRDSRSNSTPMSPIVPASTRRVGEWTANKEKTVMGPYDYLLAHPGKDIRTAMLNAFNVILRVPDLPLQSITKTIGMLHTSSLLIDDVQDGSVLRRGIPVAHNIFGVAQTINSANYVYFLALQELQNLNNKEEAQHIFVSEMLNLHRGQGMDLFWRDTLTCPTEDDYLEMVQNKTGGLFRLAVKLMQAESPEKGRIDCEPLVNLMGLVFQICDDYLNLHSGVYTANKGMCEDLTEGKFSFPVIHSIRKDPSNLQLINILKLKPTDDEVKRYAVKYMESTGSFDYTRRVVKELKAKAFTLINELDGGSGKGEPLKKILDRMDIEKDMAPKSELVQ